MNKKGHLQGQTLITLLVFSIVALTVATTAVSIMVSISQGSNRIEGHVNATQTAESGMENALLRLLRDPSYTGETLPVGEGVVLITVSGTNPKTVIAVGTVNSHIKTIKTTVIFTNGIMSVSSWTEI